MDEALIDVKLANLGKVWGLRSVRPLLLPTASELTPPSSLSGWISLCLAMGTERSQKDNVKRKIPGVGVGNMISGLRIPGKRLSSEVIPVGGGWGRAPWEPRQCPPCTPRGGGLAQGSGRWPHLWDQISVISRVRDISALQRCH